MDNFDGFPAETFTFFEDILSNNDKEWFNANKPLFKAKVQKPAQDFVVTLGQRLDTVAPNIRYDTKLTGSGSIMRIYRDVRFSKDKTPYKTNLGIVWWEGDGKKTEAPSFYFHLSADEIWFGGGIYYFPDLAKFRHAVDDPTLGAELEAVIAMMTANGQRPNSHESYKRVPRGFDKAHPRAELLKMKGLTVGFPAITRQQAMSAALVDICFDHAQSMLPLHQWLVKMMATDLTI